MKHSYEDCGTRGGDEAPRQRMGNANVKTKLIAVAVVSLSLGFAANSVAQNQITSITLTNGQVVISWNCRGTLETANQVNGPWTPVPGATSPYVDQISATQRFYHINQTVDTTSLFNKVLCGYQGWFRCPGDGGNQWIHWSRSTSTIASNTLTVDMWPDMTEYTTAEQYIAPGFTYPGDAQAYLFSAQNQQTVNRHFNWMLQYGIDGVYVQRFITDITGRPWMTNVLNYARAAANQTGRTFALEYDMSGADTNTLFSRMTNDWTWLVNTVGLTQDPRYLHHNGKPVLAIFGFYPSRFTNNPALPQQIITWFESNPVQSVTLIGSGEWWWRTDTSAGWSNIFRSFNAYIPWNTGNYSTVGTDEYATTSYWEADLAEATRVGMLYLPQIYPGFSWDNLMQLPPGTSKIPRLGGNFLWQQFYAVANLGLNMAFVGMFDEVDEGTAIFKVTNTPPTQGYFVTYDGLPTDWYLRLTDAGAQMLSGAIPTTPTIPISP